MSWLFSNILEKPQSPFLCHNYTGQKSFIAVLAHVHPKSIWESEYLCFQVCGILTETMHTAAGNIVPPEGYLQEVAQTVREFGGLIILDEVLVNRHKLW